MSSSGFCAWLAQFLVVLHFRVWWIYFCWFGFWGCVARWEPGGTGEGGAARMDFLHSSILPYHGYQTIPWIPNHTMQKQNILCHTSAPYYITYQFHIMQHIAAANDRSQGATKLYIEVFIWIWAVRCSTMVSVLRPLKASTSSSGTSVSMTFSFGLVWFEMLQNFTWQGLWSTHHISTKKKGPRGLFIMWKSHSY